MSEDSRLQSLEEQIKKQDYQIMDLQDSMQEQILDLQKQMRELNYGLSAINTKLEAWMSSMKLVDQQVKTGRGEAMNTPLLSTPSIRSKLWSEEKESVPDPKVTGRWADEADAEAGTQSAATTSEDVALDSLTLDQIKQVNKEVSDLRLGKGVHYHLKVTGLKHPSTFLSNHWIAMYCKYRDHFEAGKVLDKMAARNLYSWNNMLSGYAKQLRVTPVRKLFDKMPERDVVSWNIMIIAYVRSGHLDEAFRFYKELRGLNIGFNEFSFAGLVTVCVKLKEFRLTKQVHCQVLVAGFSLNVVLSSSIIDVYAKCGVLIDGGYRKTLKISLDNSVLIFDGAHNLEGNSFDALKGTRSRTLSWWCFDPGVAMIEFYKLGVGSIILTFGTLSPLDSFAEELKLKFPIRLENPQVIGENHIWTGVVPTDPSSYVLNFSYRSRDSLEYKQELGNAIVNFARIVSDVVLVFFPTYYLLEQCIGCWKTMEQSNSTYSCSIWERICKYKLFVVEYRQLFPFSIEDYMTKLKDKSACRAVFVVVCHDKLREVLIFGNGLQGILEFCQNDLSIVHYACTLKWFVNHRSTVCEVCLHEEKNVERSDIVKVENTLREYGILQEKTENGEPLTTLGQWNSGMYTDVVAIWQQRLIDVSHWFNPHNHMSNSLYNTEEILKRSNDKFAPGGWCMGNSSSGKNGCIAYRKPGIGKPSRSAKRLEALVLKLLDPESFRARQFSCLVAQVLLEGFCY